MSIVTRYLVFSNYLLVKFSCATAVTVVYHGCSRPVGLVIIIFSQIDCEYHKINPPQAPAIRKCTLNT